MLALLIALSSHSVCGQDAVEADQNSFQIISLGSSLSDLVYIGSKGWQDIFIPNRAFSQKFPLPTSGILDIYSDAQWERIKSGQSAIEGVSPVLSADLSNAKGNSRLLILGAVGTTANAQLIPLSGNSDTMDINTYRFYNFTDGAVIGKLGNQEFQLSPLSHKDVALKDFSNKTAQIQMAIPGKENHWKKAYNRLWEIIQGNQVFVFLYLNQSNQLKLFRVSENPTLRAKMEQELSSSD